MKGSCKYFTNCPTMICIVWKFLEKDYGQKWFWYLQNFKLTNKMSLKLLILKHYQIKKKKYQKNFDICHLIIQILFLITITCNNIYSNKCVVRTIRKTKPSELLTSLKESRSTNDKNCTFRVWQILAGGID